jgi:hypothetical protein
MKDRVSIRRMTRTGFLAVNREAIGKERGVVYSIVSMALAGMPTPAREPERPRRERRG